MKHLHYIYRFVGTALFWFFFGLIGLLIGFVVIPLLYLFVRRPGKRQVATRKLLSAAFSVFVWTACASRLISCKVAGMEHWDPDRSQLLLANHPTLIDVVILLSLFPQIDCVIKEAVTRNPVLRVPAASANYISNRAPDDLLESCVTRLRSGASLLLFPEGTRSVEGQPLKFKLGAAEIAIRARAQILPIVIDCRPQLLAKHVPWYKIPPSPPHFAITILPPVDASQYLSDQDGPRRARYTLNGALESMITSAMS